jgi:hypothetical protein
MGPQPFSYSCHSTITADMLHPVLLCAMCLSPVCHQAEDCCFTSPCRCVLSSSATTRVLSSPWGPWTRRPLTQHSRAWCVLTGGWGLGEGVAGVFGVGERVCVEFGWGWCHAMPAQPVKGVGCGQAGFDTDQLLLLVSQSRCLQERGDRASLCVPVFLSLVMCVLSLCRCG